MKNYSQEHPKHSIQKNSCSVFHKKLKGIMLVFIGLCIIFPFLTKIAWQILLIAFGLHLIFLGLKKITMSDHYPPQ